MPTLPCESADRRLRALAGLGGTRRQCVLHCGADAGSGADGAGGAFADAFRRRSGRPAACGLLTGGQVLGASTVAGGQANYQGHANQVSHRHRASWRDPNGYTPPDIPESTVSGRGILSPESMKKGVDGR
jgi:hypothetical protein